MNIKSEWKKLLAIIAVFVGFFWLPIGNERFSSAVIESLALAKWYAREHVVLCLVPAFFIAGAIAVFVSQAAVIKYFGARANKVLAYGVASVSGSILAVCSCTVLPLFAGIYRMGAGLGPATAFLYSGPAINVLAIILTARVLGLELGLARAVGAIAFSIVIGLLMHFIYRKEEHKKADSVEMQMPEDTSQANLLKNAIYFASMVGILVFANWSKPAEAAGFWYQIYSAKWIITSVFAAGLGLILIGWFEMKWYKVAAAAGAVAIAAAAVPGQPMVAFVVGFVGLSVITATDGGHSREWLESSWGFAKQILPLLFIGVLIAGFLLGRPDHSGLIPENWVATAVGGNSVRANLLASVAGSFMYFATLTEIPILQGLIGAGMGNGPALALLLAGPALSLPNMLVIRSVLGTKKTLVFVTLVVIMATISGIIFGTFFQGAQI
jgi:hypothetical protein